jgi:YidC/Oxa1 family membrane protein insertase
MSLWTAYVDIIYDALIALSVFFGGIVAIAIAVLSASARLALLPLTLRIAYRSLETQTILAQLQPQLAKLREQYKNEPQRLLQETTALYEQHGLKLFDRRTLFGALGQAPIFMGLFSAIRRGLGHANRFLWIKDLAKPDARMIALCAAVTALAAAIGPHLTSQQRSAAVSIAVVLSIVFLAKMAAGVAIYSLSSASVGVVQAVLVRRHAARISRRTAVTGRRRR